MIGIGKIARDQHIPVVAAALSTDDVEYRNLYAHFARLVAARRIDVDIAPFTLVADAYLCGRRIEVTPFIE